MKNKSNKLIKIWETYSKSLKTTKASIVDEEVYKIMANIFCPGPFYFYLVDFSINDFIYIHPNVEKILGVPIEKWSLEYLLSQVPLDDFHFIQQCERLAGTFFFERIDRYEVKNYKSVYCYRVKTMSGSVKMILQQGMTYSTDEQGRVLIALGVHTDVSHLIKSNNKRISFINILDSDKSFYGIDPFKGIVKKLKPSTQLLSNREIEIIQLLSEGNTGAEIAKQLFISSNTVRTHRKNIRKKLDCKNTIQVIIKAIRLGLI